MAEIITNLHPDGDENTNLYPNIKKQNIPSKSISTDKLDDNVLSLIGSLKPSGTDTSTNILAYTSNKGIYVATDNGHWYYWNGSAYADGGVYQSSEDINQIKSDLDELVILKKGNNIFNPTSFTAGKYYNPSTGNYGTNENYTAIDDYFEVDGGNDYFGSVWNKDTGKYAGYLTGIFIFYDANKSFMAGQQIIDSDYVIHIPIGVKYLRLSTNQENIELYDIDIRKGSYAPKSYEQYWEKKIVNPAFNTKIIVDKNGFGDYLTINEAVQNAEDGSIIYVKSGVYEEQVEAWGKTIHLIGESKDTCILKDTSGNYTTPPLEICSGSVENMSIIEKISDASVITENMGAYAVHVENNYSNNKKLLFRNCYIYSNASSGVGAGLRIGFELVLENCELICDGAPKSSGASPLYFHDADQSAYYGIANVIVNNCILRNTASDKYSMLTINSIHSENTTYLHFMRNIFTRANNGVTNKFNTWNTSGNDDADGWNGLSHMYLSDDCFGNNISELNYTID